MSKLNKNKKIIMANWGKSLVFFVVIFFVAVAVFNSLNFKEKINKTDNVEAATTANIAGFAWSENIGWISFNCVNQGTCGTIDYGVKLNTDNTLSGYAWSENIGWISFNRADTGVPPGVPYSGLETYIAKLDGTNNLTGWARALNYGDGWDGWIKFKKDPLVAELDYGVSKSGGDFTGWAWGGDDVIGWISFNSLNCDADSNNYIDSGVCGGDNATTPMSSYKVYMLNNPPSASRLNIISPVGGENCGDLGKNIFEWSFYDPDDDTQLAYQIDFYDSASPSATLICSTGKVKSSVSSVYSFVVGGGVEKSCDNYIKYGTTDYYWTVTVWDSGSGNLESAPSSIYTLSSIPAIAPPVAKFTVSNTGPNRFKFDPSLSTPPASEISKWEWDFDGDDIIDKTIVQPPSTDGITQYLYSTSGTYTANLKITRSSDGVSCSASDRSNTIDITVGGAGSEPNWNETSS